MERVPVVSSAVVSIGYDPDAEAMEVEFPAKPGEPPRVFRYFPIKPLFHERIMSGQHSIGTLVHGLRKDTTVACERVPNDPPTLRPAEPVCTLASSAAKEALA